MNYASSLRPRQEKKNRKKWCGEREREKQNLDPTYNKYCDLIG